MRNQGEIILYQPDEEIKLDVRLENETVWLSIDEMSHLFGRDISVIGKTYPEYLQRGRIDKGFSLGKNLPILLLMVRLIKWIIIILM